MGERPPLVGAVMLGTQPPRTARGYDRFKRGSRVEPMDADPAASAGDEGKLGDTLSGERNGSETSVGSLPVNLP